MVSKKTYTFKSSLLSLILEALANIKINTNLEKDAKQCIANQRTNTEPTSGATVNNESTTESLP